MDSNFDSNLPGQVNQPPVCPPTRNDGLGLGLGPSRGRQRFHELRKTLKSSPAIIPTRKSRPRQQPSFLTDEHEYLKVVYGANSDGIFFENAIEFKKLKKLKRAYERDLMIQSWGTRCPPQPPQQ